MSDSFDVDGWDDDDLLAAALADALAEDAAVPARVRHVGRELYVWRTLDAELSDMAEVEASTSAGLRDDESRWQTWSFRAGTVTVELDLDTEGGRLRGQVDAAAHAEEPAPSDLVVEGPSFDAVHVPVDEVGYFAAELGAPLPRFRLRVGSVVTPFVG